MTSDTYTHAELMMLRAAMRTDKSKPFRVIWNWRDFRWLCQVSYYTFSLWLAAGSVLWRDNRYLAIFVEEIYIHPPPNASAFRWPPYQYDYLLYDLTESDWRHLDHWCMLYETYVGTHRRYDERGAIMNEVKPDHLHSFFHQLYKELYQPIDLSKYTPIGRFRV